MRRSAMRVTSDHLSSGRTTGPSRGHPALPRLLLPALLAFAAPASAGEYLVLPPPLGDDAGTGREDRPFATVAKAVSRAGSGDTILLQRGAVYHEVPFTFPGGVTVKAIGPEDRPPPTITTSVVLAGFKPWEKNPKVLCRPVEKKVLECYVDGRFLILARYPNQGWMRTRAGTTPDLIVDPERAKAPGAAPGRWQGAQVRWRRWSWWWETRPITGDDGQGRIRLGPENRFRDPFCGEGSAWCVDDCLAELDAPGEWCWDGATKTLYLFPPAGADPKKMEVEAVTTAEGFADHGATLEGIAFARIAGNALRVSGKTQITRCTFEDIGDTALGGGGSGTVVSGCTFRDVRNVAVAWDERGSGSTFERNLFERVGMQFGYGGSGSWHAAGMILNAGKGGVTTVRFNRFVDIGYAGTILNAPGQVIEHNVFVRCMGSLNDGAAVYANCSQSVIRENIILDTIGNLETSQFWYPLGHGIWPEFLEDFREQTIVGNTVFGSDGNGIFLTNNYACTVSDNLLVGNRLAGLYLSPGEKNRAPQGHTLAGNVVVCLVPPRRRVQTGEQLAPNGANDSPRGVTYTAGVDYGKMTGTIFVVPPGVPLMQDGGKRWEDPAAWRAALSWADPAPRVVKAAALLLANDTEQEAEVRPPGGGWVGLDGKAVGRGVKLKPYRGAVVVRDGGGEGLPPYVLASGTDYRDTAGPRARAKPKAAPGGEDREAKKAADADKTAAEAAAQATPTPEAWARYVGRLRELAAAAVARRQFPRFASSVMGGPAVLEELAGNQADQRVGGARATVDLFGRIPATDARSLALDLAREGDASAHAVAAFFCRCAQDGTGYAEHLRQAGAGAAEVEASFPAVK
jgi:parallel beta-helix repeat protein